MSNIKQEIESVEGDGKALSSTIQQNDGGNSDVELVIKKGNFSFVNWLGKTISVLFLGLLTWIGSLGVELVKSTIKTFKSSSAANATMRATFPVIQKTYKEYNEVKKKLPPYRLP
jgi:hypothetical protein